MARYDTNCFIGVGQNTCSQVLSVYELVSYPHQATPAANRHLSVRFQVRETGRCIYKITFNVSNLT